MRVRLVAYRKETSSSTADKAYELDLQEEPNISLNYQFADIKEPEKRKASYSQTFKLPFTDNNNDFFQNWFDVNLSTLVYSASAKFNAVLYVGSLPQFDGVIQLKSVYLQAELYEVILLSHSADLFTNIGSKKLRDVFLKDDGTYDVQLNHTFNETNIKRSWNGSSSAFQNSSGQTLRDSDANVQKVMYPLSVTEPNFFFNLNPTFGSSNIMGNITQFRPAIQIRSLLKFILAKAGFSYTSTFIDTDYFGRLFMTTCNHETKPEPNIVQPATGVDGVMVVGNSSPIATINLAAGVTINCDTGIASDGTNPWGWRTLAADTVSPPTGFTIPNDPYSLWNTTFNYVKIPSSNVTSLQARFWLKKDNIVACANSSMFYGYNLEWRILQVNVTGGTVSVLNEGVYYASDWVNSSGAQYQLQELDMEFNANWDLQSLSGVYVKVEVRLANWQPNDASQPCTVEFGSSQCSPESASCSAPTYLYGGSYSQVSMVWNGFQDTIYDKIVSVPRCIDPSITQKAFLKDIIQRFNLVVLSDPDDSTNLIIETYNDYLGNGAIKHWTDKLDTSKEIVVKDTTSLQNQTIKLGDLDDNDTLNKRIKETNPTYSPYGKIEIVNTLNEFASGTMTNQSIFSPYMNEKVYAGLDTTLPTQINNMTVQYEISYTANSDGLIEQKLQATKPKLFYYSGTPSPVPDGIPNWKLKRSTFDDAGVETVIPYEFTEHPLCSPFELTVDANGVANLTADTRSLLWNANPPPASGLACFNYGLADTELMNSLYYQYWAQYLNAVYDKDSRIMECYLNLDVVDIFNFKFNDEIFIRDSYYRILSISNYQIGGKASTKVTLLKINEIYEITCSECQYVTNSSYQATNGNNSLYSYLVWCPEWDPNCTPTITGSAPAALLTTEVCCECNNGTWTEVEGQNGLGYCQANTSSLPIKIENFLAPISILSNSVTKNLMSGILGGVNNPFTVGTNANKYSSYLLPLNGNDIVIKHRTFRLGEFPLIYGESHKIILVGKTTGTTRSYAYIDGNVKYGAIVVPPNSNMVLRLKGVVTVIGGTSATYPLGYTEAFAYYTAFKAAGTKAVQVSSVGGKTDFSIAESGASQCTMYINTTDNVVNFGLDDAQADTVRMWQITADIDVNRIPNMELSYDQTHALWQNSEFILFENFDYLLWN